MDLSTMDLVRGPAALEIEPSPEDGSFTIKLPALPKPLERDFDLEAKTLDELEKCGAARRRKDAALAAIPELEAKLAAIAAQELAECRPMRAERDAITTQIEQAKRAAEDAEIEAKGRALRAWAAAREVGAVVKPRFDAAANEVLEFQNLVKAAIKGLDVLHANARRHMPGYSFSVGPSGAPAYLERELVRAGLEIPSQAAASSAEGAK